MRNTYDVGRLGTTVTLTLFVVLLTSTPTRADRSPTLRNASAAR